MDEGRITRLEIQKRNKQRVNVYLEDEYSFSLSLDDAMLLHKGQMLSRADVERLRDGDELVRAVDRAARFLGHRPRSEHEVRHNLAQKDTPEPVIDAAIERLRALGYLDDHAFARYWVQERTTFKPLSPRALRYELRQKGVADAVIGEVLTDLDADDAAFRAAQSHVRKLRGLTRREFKNRLGAFLQRRGFSYSDIRGVVSRLIEDLELNDPEFFDESAGRAGEDDLADE